MRFQITSLSGSLLLPETPLRMTPSVAVRVPPGDYDQVVRASEASEAEGAATVRGPQKVSTKGRERQRMDFLWMFPISRPLISAQVPSRLLCCSGLLSSQ